MKEIKSYTSIWNVEKIIYSLMNVSLPVPLTFTQIAWFMGVLFADIIFRNIPPLALTDNVLLKYIAIPAGLTWLMSQKTFDGKKPYSFLRSVIAYYINPKVTYAGKIIKMENEQTEGIITVVKSFRVYPEENRKEYQQMVCM